MRSQVALFAAVVALASWTTAAAWNQAAGTPGAQEHPAGDHHHAEGVALKNPIKPTPASIAAGKAVYDKQCVTCHGATGKGDGKMAAAITGVKPSDMTDATWKHGSTDGEIHIVIRDGVKGTGMRGYAARMKTEDIWNVVNYLRTLAPAPPK